MEIQSGLALKEITHKQDQAVKVAAILKCLAHPARLMAVCFLLGGERYAREITGHLRTTKSNASQHLSALMTAGVILREGRGNQNAYRIADDNMRDLITFLEQRYCPQGALTIQEASHDRIIRTQGC